MFQNKAHAVQPLETTDRTNRLALLRQAGGESGFFQGLGMRHWGLFSEDGGDLIVTFDRLETIRAGTRGQMPATFNMATRRGWSHLSMISEGESWYRDPAIFAFFDGLTDGDFFDRFDRVLFYGARMGAYAACAYSVAAPGSAVLALEPRATLDPRLAGWDRRHGSQRKLDFRGRYGYAPDMVEAASRVWLLADPWQAEDAMHCALFRAGHVHALQTPHAAGHLEALLLEMDVLPHILQAAMEERFGRIYFNTLWRKRRNAERYLQQILKHCQATGHPAREAAICRSVLARMHAPGFQAHLKGLERKGLPRPPKR